MELKSYHKEELCLSVVKAIDYFGRNWVTLSGAILTLDDDLYFFRDNGYLTEEQIQLLLNKFQEFMNTLDKIRNEIK